MDQLREFLIKNGVVAVVVFAATYAANLWFEREKTIDSLRLEDSTIIMTRANDLWETIFKLESIYKTVDELRSQREFDAKFKRPVDEKLHERILLARDELLAKHRQVQRQVSESSHLVGDPLVRHMAIYLSVLESYYEAKDSLHRSLEADPRADVAYMTQHVKELGAHLYQMRGDVRSTRAYALDQVRR